MILTVCPNPSIDCTVELQSLDVGKMNRIENKILTYSGKAFWGMIDIIRASQSFKEKNILFWNTGGIYNLLSTKLEKCI